MGQYLVLNDRLQVVGDLSTTGGTIFYDDDITVQIANTETTTSVGDSLTGYESANATVDLNALNKEYDHSGQILVPQGQPMSDYIIAGNYLAYYDTPMARWYLLNIYSTDEIVGASGLAVTTAYVVNACLMNMAKTTPDIQSWTSANAQTVFTALLAGSGWTLDFDATTALTNDISFDGLTNAYSYLQDLSEDYNVDCDAYVEFSSSGKLANKVIQITDELSAGMITDEIELGKNMTGLTRTVNYANIITKIIPIGANSENIASVNNGKNYLVDDTANEAYNPDWQSSYLEATLQASTIDRPAGLLEWGKAMLTLYNHPRVTYTITATSDFNPPLGANIRVKDFGMTPALTAEARVISKEFSFANMTYTLTFGEFTTITAVTPSWIAGQLSTLKTAVASAQDDASAISVNVLYPDGTTFSDTDTSKRLIMQAKVGTENISSYLADQGFIWEHLNQDGSLDTSWSATGYLLQATASQIGTVRAIVDNSYIQADPEVTVTTNEATAIGTFDSVQGDTNLYACQYLVRLSTGQYLTAHHHTDDTWYCLWSEDLICQSKMIVTNGGHGSSFGVEEVDNVIYIWANTADSNGDNWLSRFAYTAGTTISDSSITRYLKMTTAVRVNYDANHDYLGFSNTKGVYQVIPKSDVMAGNNNVIYSVDLSQGHNFDATTQTYQSQCLDFPYLYWHSGNEDMTDARVMYGLNLVHAGDEFEIYYDFTSDFPIANPVQEPEGISLLTNADGSRDLLVTFNTLPEIGASSTTEVEYVFTVPLSYRQAVADIDTGSFEEVD